MVQPEDGVLRRPLEVEHEALVGRPSPDVDVHAAMRDVLESAGLRPGRTSVGVATGCGAAEATAQPEAGVKSGRLNMSVVLTSVMRLTPLLIPGPRS